MANSGKLNILYGEGDAEVLKSQTAAMQKAGHQVQAAEGRKAVEAALKQGNYDLVVLGSTLTRDDRHHLPYMVKKAHLGLRVLVLHADGGRHPYVDGNVDTGSNMATMLDKIADMMGKKAMAQGAGR
jgi:DNA-binding NtrC family response regulator